MAFCRAETRHERRDRDAAGAAGSSSEGVEAADLPARLCQGRCECAKDRADHPKFLLRLAELELLDRERRLVERRIRATHFQAVESLDTFDFTAIPSLNKMLVLDLARCDNIIALGNSGTGALLDRLTQHVQILELNGEINDS
ncbi:putative ATP-binding protein [Acidiphilium multivorum AIU301]|uniref:Putative ATP-binding protein n=1 Tax=Acidiphilium multivorum (strain DSM 11245 / JCM 8867 / NBRC 100883 / AIU 301) TaxID=926570 RepID=F0J1R6_ACIMA|nr:ATP-binding protein [Acidiphilium multivorum]BAJ81809.1 putative ATP-binding protein [Acidiphilium multivorum AIU301]